MKNYLGEFIFDVIRIELRIKIISLQSLSKDSPISPVIYPDS
jgi:hypothetical protein